jgi:hypothetical protein
VDLGRVERRRLRRHLPRTGCGEFVQRRRLLADDPDHDHDDGPASADDHHDGPASADDDHDGPASADHHDHGSAAADDHHYDGPASADDDYDQAAQIRVARKWQ